MIGRVRANRWALANNRPSGAGATETILAASAGGITLTPQPATLTYTPWTPASLPNLELWLANSSLAAIGDAQPIAQWDDESGNARHAVQASATNRPTVRLAGDGIYEVKGDGVDDYMVSTFGATIAQPTTLWAVGSIGPAGTVRTLFDDSAAADQQTLMRRVAVFRMQAGAAFDWATQDGDLHSFVLIFNGASSKFRVDGVETTGNAGTLSTSGRILFARQALSQFSDGVLRTVGVNAGVLAGDDLTQLETHMATLRP